MNTQLQNNNPAPKLSMLYGKPKYYVQPKLTVNTPGDIYEQEADAMADRVMRMSSNEAAKPVTGLIGKSIQRKCAHCEEEENRKKPIMRKAEAGNAGMPVSSSFTATLNASKGGGSPLPQGTRSFMENAFSTDFSAVRIHTDTHASKMSRGINAKAFTYGNDIYFGSGEYATNSRDGKKLLAHELTHVIQQYSNIQRKLKFEFQTHDVILFKADEKGNLLETLPRKFPVGDKPGKEGNAFLHKENGAELQAETGGIAEFETNGWFKKWSKLKRNIEGAVSMTEAMKKAPKATGIKSGSFSTTDLRVYPFALGSHLVGTRLINTKAKQKIIVDIGNGAFNAKIQASEAFELPQFESYLKQHLNSKVATQIIGNAGIIISEAQADSTKKYADSNLKNLFALVEIIIMYLLRTQMTPKARADKLHAKEFFPLMSRTNLSSIYKKLLTKSEKKLYKKIVEKSIITAKMGLGKEDMVYKFGFSGNKGPKISTWLKSIYNNDKDSLTTMKGGSYAMGRFNVETGAKSKNLNLVKFETRASVGLRNNKIPSSDWVDFAEQTFLEAFTCRSRTGKTALKYDGSKTFGGICK